MRHVQVEARGRSIGTKKCIRRRSRGAPRPRCHAQGQFFAGKFDLYVFTIHTWAYEKETCCRRKFARTSSTTDGHPEEDRLGARGFRGVYRTRSRAAASGSGARGTRIAQCSKAKMSLRARGETSTRKAMDFPESTLRLLKWNSFAAFELLHALADCCDGLGALQPVD